MIEGIEKEMKQINAALELARKHSLEAEVVWSALQYHKKEDDLAKVLDMALDDWDI